ncbi:MAG: hypothetical protein WC554_18020 [Clostridia bacterium]
MDRISIAKQNNGAYVGGEPYVMFNKPNENPCLQREYFDNGYLFGYYCSITGNKCDFNGFEECCTAFDGGEEQGK